MRKLTLVLLLSFLHPLGLADTPAERGLAIAKEADLRDQGFHDYETRARMTLRNAQDEERLYEMRWRGLETAGYGDKTLIVFDDPADVRGTAMLTWSHKGGMHEQWLYVPAYRKEKRIVSRARSRPFMGSEFTYEDLISQKAEMYSYKYLRDEELGGQACFVIEREPADPNSGYTRQIVWIDQVEYRPQKIEFYDRKESLLKTLVFRDYGQYLGKYWRASEVFMENHETGTSTRIDFAEYRFQTGQRESDFSRSALPKATQ